MTKKEINKAAYCALNEYFLFNEYSLNGALFFKEFEENSDEHKQALMKLDNLKTLIEEFKTTHKVKETKEMTDYFENLKKRMKEQQKAIIESDVYKELESIKNKLETEN